MPDDPADDAAVRAVLEESQRQIEAAAREASRLEAKWDGTKRRGEERENGRWHRFSFCRHERKRNSTSRPRRRPPKTKTRPPSPPGYCGLVQACEEDEGWGDVLRDQLQQREHHEIDFSPEALSALRSRLEALRCAAVSAAVAPARAAGNTEPQASDPAATAAAAASDAAYAAAIERVKAGDMPGAAAKLRDALFVEERPRARERIEKYLGAVEAKIFR